MANNRRTILNKSYQELKQLEGKKLYGAKKFGTSIGINRRAYLWIASKVRDSFHSTKNIDREKMDRLVEKKMIDVRSRLPYSEQREIEIEYEVEFFNKLGGQCYHHFHFEIYGTCLNKDGEDVTITVSSNPFKVQYYYNDPQKLENTRVDYFIIEKVVSDEELEEW